MSAPTISLDLGSGPKPKNPFHADLAYGVDIVDFGDATIKVADLAIEPIPFASEFADYIIAADFIEHVPRIVYLPHRRNCFVELMNEIWRVLKFDGMFLSRTPAYPHQEAFLDPTHVNIITESTFPFYFDDTNRWAERYGFTGAFAIAGQSWDNAHLITALRKVPVRPKA